MAFLDKLFRWKKKPFAPAQVSTEQKLQAGKAKTDKFESQGTGKFANVLVRPHISEKAVAGEARGRYVFEVVPSATKQEVALAVRDLYGVIPEAVNMISVAGKQLRFGRTSGATKHWKKAIVTLPKGKSIEVYKK